MKRLTSLLIVMLSAVILSASAVACDKCKALGLTHSEYIAAQANLTDDSILFTSKTLSTTAPPVTHSANQWQQTQLGQDIGFSAMYDLKSESWSEVAIMRIGTVYNLFGVKGLNADAVIAGGVLNRSGAPTVGTFGAGAVIPLKLADNLYATFGGVARTQPGGKMAFALILGVSLHL